MNLFIDKNHRRKSPIAIAGFFSPPCWTSASTGFCIPCWQSRCTGGFYAQHCNHQRRAHADHRIGGDGNRRLLFLLRDKRVALFGFVGLAVVLVMFYCSLDAGYRPAGNHGALITLYGVAPALIGNAVAWPVYLKLRKTHPLPVQKTLQEEMREAAGTKADAAPQSASSCPGC